MILSAQSIRRRCVQEWGEGSRRFAPMIDPFFERAVARGMSYGLSSNGYDVRVGPSLAYPNAEFSRVTLDPEGPMIVPRRSFVLAATVERFDIPLNLCMRVLDKSSLARQGIFVQNTIAEAGWRGWLTLEISNDSYKDFPLWPGTPIAQCVFEMLDEATVQPYGGKYQDQPPGPQTHRSET